MVVLHFGFDSVDRGHVDVARFHLRADFPDRSSSTLRDNAEVGLRLSGVGYDQVPDAELVSGFPDGNHVGAGITGVHGGSLGTVS